ncbi:MAG: hypothetical protein ACF8SC_11595 [Phycisphaerales bacterium JB037]
MFAGRHADGSGSPERETDSGRRLTREQVVSRILSLNAGATRDFLDEFDDDDLDTYLARLTWTQEPRGRRATWVRKGDSPAIQTRRFGR